ncbi:hypothetical protein LCGC14_0219970 [marine sediment metagenome]|uniref:Uncharacterized protein n=1 Tax=marine sediment metagenome TaxID=412755 RepID=A0A0F9UUF7_9ZZZZ
MLETIQELIDRYQRKICFLRFCLKICLFGWLFTLLSVGAVLYTGKIPPIEIKMNKPDFGSVYPKNFWNQNDD